MATIYLGKNYGTDHKYACISKDDASYTNGYLGYHIWGPPTVWRIMFDVQPNTFTLLKFDLSTIPPGALITSAKLYYYYLYGSGTTHVVSTCRLKTDWGISAWYPGDGVAEVPNATGGKPSFGYAFSATTRWGSGGAFAIATDAFATEDVTTSTPTPTNGTWYNNTVTNMVNSWMGGATNYGLALCLVSANTGTAQEYIGAYDAANPQLNPYLEINYIPANIFLGMDY